MKKPAQMLADLAYSWLTTVSLAVMLVLALASPKFMVMDC